MFSLFHFLYYYYLFFVFVILEDFQCNAPSTALWRAKESCFVYSRKEVFICTGT